MSTAVAQTQKPENGNRPKPSQVPAIREARLPYHPLIQERFNIDKASWKALVEAVFPTATTIDSVLLALSYCRARKLDPFKRNVHIVPIWDRDRRCYVDTIWPGIGELRTTAFRTGCYAGRDKTEFGPTVKKLFKAGENSVEVSFPEWAQVTVYRVVNGERVAFAGPQVEWLETYATVKHDSDVPNTMWATRPRGQLDKCAEAAALRAAFPEEISDYIPEEVQHGPVVVTDKQRATIAGPSQTVQRSQLNESLSPDDEPQETVVDPPEVGETGDATVGEEVSGEEASVAGADSAANEDYTLSPLALELEGKLQEVKTREANAKIRQDIIAAKELTDDERQHLEAIFKGNVERFKGSK